MEIDWLIAHKNPSIRALLFQYLPQGSALRRENLRDRSGEKLARRPRRERKTRDRSNITNSDERLALIEQLWDSLENYLVQMTPAQEAELERRLRTVDHGRVRSVTGKHSRQNSSVARGVAGPFHQGRLDI